MENERCENCTFYSILQHNFKTGVGFERSNCCVLFPITESAGYVVEVSPNDRCEMFTRRAEDESKA